jgi:PAS domain S-box-containing protein
VSLALVGSGFAALYLVQSRNYLLFHSLVEILSILVAFAVFIITWNAREELEHSFVVILGVGYLFVGGLDLLHTLAYKGLGVFPGAGADLPTQLWLLSRYLESVSLLGAGLVGILVDERGAVDLDWHDRTLLPLVAGYAVVGALGLGSIFVFDVFPQAYDPDEGLTRFKILSEYLVVGLFAAGLALLYRQRETFDARVFRLLAVSLLLTMGSELAFTFYVDVYGFSNAVGHFLKLASFYLIYLAVVKTGIKDPQKTLYRTLARREAEARKFKKAADYSGHAILITDRDGAIQYVNSSWEDVTGYSAGEVIGRTPRLLKSGEHDETFYEEMWDTVLAGNAWEGNLVNERKNGERFVIHQTTAPIFAEGGDIEGFVAIHDEITEQKAYEKRLETDLQQSVTQLQVLARVLRHNVRNGMSVILGNAETIREETSDERVEERASTIETSGERLLSHAEKQRKIVQLLLDPPPKASVALPEIVDGVVERIASRYPRASITVEIPSKLELRTVPELRTAIEELIENAVEHSDRETPHVSIRARRRERTIEIQVEDDGPGIPPVERQVITGEADVDALLHSSGMGLWLVAHIVAHAGGTIRFEDAQPRGSVVTLVVPFHPPTDDSIGS